MKARRLKKLCELINEHGAYNATIEKGYCNTDYKPKGFRYITRKGKGRTGNKLVVRDPMAHHAWHKDGSVIFEHNSAETYRCNREVEEWIKSHLPKKFWHPDFQKEKS